MMASKVFECEICTEDYDAADRKPASLPCGHTFCRSCLTNIVTTSGITCPNCRQLFEQPVDELPVIFALIPSFQKPSPETHSLHMAARCQQHNGNLDHFCADCNDILCRKCCRLSHQQHRVEFMQDVLYKDEVASEFTDELRQDIKLKIFYSSTTTEILRIIFDYVDEMKNCCEKMKQCEDMFPAVEVSTTEVLNLWDNTGSKSRKEEEELFKKLCKAWEERGVLVSDDEKSSNFLKMVNKVIFYSRQVETRAETVKENFRY